jgi:hypothetical protein
VLAALALALSAGGCIGAPQAGSAGQQGAPGTAAPTAETSALPSEPAVEASPEPSAVAPPAPEGAPAAAAPTPEAATPVSTNTSFTPEQTGNPAVDALGNRLFWPLTAIEGPGEYRIGNTEWFLEVPAGMRLVWSSVLEGSPGELARWVWTDAATGSQLVVLAADVTDLERTLQGEASARALADANFDAIINSVSRQVMN